MAAVPSAVSAAARDRRQRGWSARQPVHPGGGRRTAASSTAISARTLTLPSAWVS